MDNATAVVNEAIKEAVGLSPRKWALVVVAFAAGALGVVLLTRRARAASPATVQAEAATG
jgi:hypothetical protein